MSQSYLLPPEANSQLDLVRNAGFAAGLLLLVVSAVGAFFSPEQFFRSYLFGYLFWIGLALGSLALLMTQYLTGGSWGVLTRRTFEAATRTLPVLAILFLPIIFGIHFEYPWSHHDLVTKSEVMRHRSSYMNTPMFIGRALLYFAIWIGMSYLLNRLSAREDAEDPLQERLEQLSAPGLILYVFSVTFAMVDWAQSIFPEWYSTMWGFLFVAGQGLTSMCLATLVLVLLWRYQPLNDVFKPTHLQDLGKLLLMFVMLWAYFAFSQFLIVWSGNLTSEIPWYMPRWQHSWVPIGVALIALEFGLPFLLLLSSSLKKNPRAMTGIVGLILLMRLVNMYWLVMPDFYRNGLRLHWLQFTVPFGIGALWTGTFAWQLGKRPLLPSRAVNFEELVRHAD